MIISESKNFAFPNADGFQLIPAHTTTARNQVYSLRHRAYRASGVMTDSVGDLFYDDYDSKQNCFSFLLLHEGRPMGSIRANRKVLESDEVGAMDAFGPELRAAGIAGNSFVESNRFVIDPSFERRGIRALIQLMRGIRLHTALADARYVVTAVRVQHVDFYRRFLKMYPISKPAMYPGLDMLTVLLAADVKRDSKSVFDRIPELAVMEDEIASYAEYVGL
ncbi:hypothetical protein [Oricola sp.]|uniref:N-acyl amino acid synthase FeeM domain-containing protein n=1 Tax=Oricola sp. TaxID=1979950 RepID=UPI0025D81496|nr:hypothetical protein [Oricola sp.]MCI5076869.1 hypothetical protein [Oricola sp.]